MSININDVDYPTHPQFDRYYNIHSQLIQELIDLIEYFKTHPEESEAKDRLFYLEEAFDRMYKFDTFVDRAACPEAFRMDDEEYPEDMEEV